MEPPSKKVKKSYITWSIAERNILIQKRIERDDWFCGKNANSNEGWRKIPFELKGQIGEEKNLNACKTQWNALMKKYKSFFKYRSGEGTGEEATAEDANDWEFFDIIHTYASKKDNYHPPYLIDSSDGVINAQKENNSDILNSTQQRGSTTSSSKLRPEFKKIEEHIKKGDKKISKQISSLLSVLGQMVQADYPHINTSTLFVSSHSDSD